MAAVNNGGKREEMAYGMQWRRNGGMKIENGSAARENQHGNLNGENNESVAASAKMKARKYGENNRMAKWRRNESMKATRK
jgi:hypothetical protein